MTPEDSGDLKKEARRLIYWGQVPVHVTSGDIEFTTALYPGDGRYRVPVKVAVQRAEAIEEADTDLPPGSHPGCCRRRSARIAALRIPELDLVASERVHEAAPLADEPSSGSIGPLHAEELHAAGVELDLLIVEQVAPAHEALEPDAVWSDGDQRRSCHVTRRLE